MTLTAAARALKERQKNRNLPTVEVPLVKEDELARTLQGIQEHLRMYEGDSGAPKERFITLAELENAGLIKSDVKGRFAYISQVLEKDVSQLAGSTANPTQTDSLKNDTSRTAMTPGGDLSSGSGSTASASKLNDNSDVNFANPANNEFLYFDGNKFTTFPLFKKPNNWFGSQQFESPIVMREQATGPEALGGLGYTWVRDDAPTIPMYTDDDGTEWSLAQIDSTGNLDLTSLNGMLTVDRYDAEALYEGIALDSPSVTVASDGATITLSMEKSGGGDIRFYFHDQADKIITVDCTPAATVALTPGTDAVPVENFVYVLESTGVLTAATSWPSGVHYAPVATVLCQSAASAQTYGLYKVHAWTNHAVGNQTGHIGDINYWIRQQNATWTSGSLLTANAGAATFDIATSTGEVLQLHPHAMPAFDTSAASHVHIVNDSVTSYLLAADLTGITLDATGASLSSKYFNLVIWGVVSEDTGDCQLMVNLPSDVYTVSADAQTDIDGSSVYAIPSAFRGVGFLIARLTMRLVGTTYTEILNTDLRGLFPSVTAGGSGGGGGGVAALPDLSDVDTAAATAGFFIANDPTVGGNYYGRAIVKADIDGLALDLGVLTATSYGGIAETNLVDKSAAETVTGNWNLNGTTVGIGPSGNLNITANVTQILSGKHFRIYNSGNTDYVNFAHDGTNLNITGANTTWIDVEAAGVRLLNGNNLEMRDATNADTAVFSHDGTDFNLALSGTTDWNITGATNYKFDSDVIITGDISANNLPSLETKYKTADEAFSTSSTTLQDDDHLTGFALDANSYYKVEGYLNINVDTVTPDFKCQFIFTNTPQDGWFTLTGGNDNGAALDGDHGQYSVALVLNFTVANGWGIHVSGFIRSNASTGGTFKLQWAKNSIAVGDTTTLKLGTWLTATKMS